MGLQKSTIPKAGQGVIARPLACLAERTFPVGLRVACNGHKCRIPSGDGEAVDCSIKAVLIFSFLSETLGRSNQHRVW